MNAGAISRKDWSTLSLALVVSLAAGAAHGRIPAVGAFLSSAAALSLLAVVVGHATEHLSTKLSAGATGVLQSALGNLPELMVCIFSLRAGLVEVVKGALIGSILANSVLVLGLALLFGGWKNGTLRFQSAAPRMTAVLMLLACTALSIPSLANYIHAPASLHQRELSLVSAVILLVIFGCSLPFFLSGDKELVTPDPEHHSHLHWPLPMACGVLLMAGIGSAFVSDWFVDALKPATTALGLSEAFTGLVVVAIAGNAIENLVGIQLAVKNKPDLSLSVILNSSLQIALMLIPVLVIASALMGGSALTLTLTPMLLAVMLFSAVVPAFVVFDGEAIWLEGAALVGLYALFATAFWWG